jgi:hypothetical protein
VLDRTPMMTAIVRGCVCVLLALWGVVVAAAAVPGSTATRYWRPDLGRGTACVTEAVDVVRWWAARPSAVAREAATLLPPPSLCVPAACGPTDAGWTERVCDTDAAPSGPFAVLAHYGPGGDGASMVATSAVRLQTCLPANALAADAWPAATEAAVPPGPYVWLACTPDGAAVHVLSCRSPNCAAASCVRTDALPTHVRTGAIQAACPRLPAPLRHRRAVANGTCVLQADGTLIVAPSLAASCIALFDGNYTFLAQNQTHANTSIGVFTQVNVPTTIIVEAYTNATCQGLGGFFTCTVTALPTSVPTTAAPTTAVPTTAVPTGGPTACVLQADGALVVVPPSGSACAVVYNVTYAYVGQNVTVGGAAVLRQPGALSSRLYVEGYGRSNCTVLVGYFSCGVVVLTPAPTTAAPTTAAPTTAAPTTAVPTGGPTACVLQADGALVVAPLFAAGCLAVYDGSYRFLSQNQTGVGGAGLFATQNWTAIIYVEGYASSHCQTYMGYFQCAVAPAGTVTPTAPVPTTAAPTTAVPTGGPTACVLQVDGTLVVTPPFASGCLALYNGAYAYLTQNQTGTDGLGVFAELDLTATVYVEGYASSHCQTYIGYFQCTVAPAATVTPTTVVVPTGSPLACIVQPNGALVVTPSFATKCLAVYDGAYAYLTQNQTDGDGLGLFAPRALPWTSTLYVEGYDTDDCKTLLGFFVCTAVFAPTAAPTTAVPTTPVPTGGATACVLDTDNVLTLLPPPSFRHGQCLGVYDSALVFLAELLVTGADGSAAVALAGYRDANGTAPAGNVTLHIETYRQADCTDLIGYFQCTVVFTQTPTTTQAPGLPQNEAAGGRLKNSGSMLPWTLASATTLITCLIALVGLW